MKKTICLIIALCMVFAMLPVIGGAADVVDSGTCGDNLTWMLDSNGTLTISGTGNMWDFHEFGYAYGDSRPWYSNVEDITKVIIEYGVTGIGDWAFYDCTNLTSVTIPNSVTSIGDYAFGYCSKLTSVNIPSSVTSIGYDAFYRCESLTSITIPSSVTRIASSAFERCSGLTSVTIPSSVTSIEDFAFGSCNSLMSMTIPNSVSNIGPGAFDGCSSLTSAIIPSSVTGITWAAFCGCSSLKTVKLPSTVTFIEYEAFYACDCLTDVYYSGTKAQWEQIWLHEYSGLEGNDPLLNATIHYNSTGPDDPYDTSSHTSKAGLNVQFMGGIYKEDGKIAEMNIPWNRDDFSQMFGENSSVMKEELVFGSLVLSADVYKYSRVEKTLKDMGFDNVKPYNYDDSTESDYGDTVNRVGHAIGSTVRIINGQPTNIVAVACRGSVGAPDWISNIVQGGDGFRKAARNVRDNLKEYLADPENGIDTSLPTKLFITGHSRGGAAANILGTIVSDITDLNNVYVYTFACPNTTTDKNRQSYNNIFNIIVDGDIVPLVPPMVHTYFINNNKFGSVTRIKAHPDRSEYDSAFRALTGGVSSISLDDPSIECVGYPSGFRHHAPATFMAYLVANSTYKANSVEFLDEEWWSESEFNIKCISVLCPVDVLVYDVYGNLLGSIVNNVPDDELLSNGVYVEVEGDEKYIYTTENRELRIELVGSDAGTMEYSVEKLNTDTGEVAEEKSFGGVELAEGKTMTTDVASDINVADTKLFVLTDDEITAEVLTDGSERDVAIISFDTGSGEPIRDVSVPKGEAAGALPEASLAGYSFDGWYLDEGLTEPFDPAAPIGESLTLHAKYSEAYDAYADFASVKYDGSAVTATMAFGYNKSDSKVIAALYQNDKMISAGVADVNSGDGKVTVSLPASGLYGVYVLKVFTLDRIGGLMPINLGVETSFYAD